MSDTGSGPGNPNAFGSGKRRWLRRRGWTQEELAKRFASHPDLVQRIQEGLFPLSPELRQQLIEWYGPHRLPSSPEVLAPLDQPFQERPPDFTADPEVVRTLVEGERLSHAYLFNPTFAAEVALIDPLPHQRLAVYEHMLPQPRLRFLLADDAGAGKTIMTGLYIREMLSRRLIRRVLIVPPAGLVGNWERELRTLFNLPFRIVLGSEARGGNPFLGSGSDLLIVSVDTLAGERLFGRLQEPEVEPYDLVVFDEAHKLSASFDSDGHLRATDRYRLAEALAGIPSDEPRWSLSWSCHHLLLLTATPHMGKADAYYCLWRLLEPELLSTMQAFEQYPPKAIESYLRQEIESCSYLAPSRASYPPSVHIHKLPREPRDVDDDGDLRLVILGPEGACRPERPSELALRFLNEKSGPEAPRVYRNAIIVVAPHSRGLDGAREAIRSYLGWCDVEERLKREEQEIDSNRQVLLEREKKESEVRLKELVRESYCIVVAFSASNVAEAFQIKPGSNLYASLRADERVRLSEQPIEAEALLPGGPYELWREGETARRYKDLLDAFAQFVHLPRIVDRNAIKQTLINGCLQGQFVFRQPRPDRSYRTCWRQRPDEEVLRDPALEVVLAEEASLTSLAPELLQPGALPGLWEGDELPLSRLYAYFAGGHVVEEQRDGYSETLIIPRAESAAIRQAVREAVRGRQLWLLSGRSSFLGEEVADDVLSEQARLRRPRDPLAASEILPENLPAAWQGEQTTARAIADALAERFGVPLPWLSVQAAIEDAFQQRLLERSLDSGPWPCDYAGARAVKILVVHPEAVHAGLQSTLMGAASASTLRERPLTYAPLVRAEAPVDSEAIQSLAEVLPELFRICGDNNLTPSFQLAIEIEPASRVTGEVLERLNALLTSKVSSKLTFRPPSE